MALTANTNPTVIPSMAAPYDVATAFANAQTLTASGSVNNVQTQVDVGPGRVIGQWILDLTALDLTSGDETYKFFLLGSNDVNFGNGNADLLAFHDFAAASSGRVLPTVLAASPTVPITNKTATRHHIPYTNLMGGFVFRYLQCQAVLGGTTPSVSLSSWLTSDLMPR